VDFQFDHFGIDIGQQQLSRAGVSVHVEPQVFDVLVHLIRHRDRVVSKDELIETVWNGRIISEAALSSRINAARRALGDSGSEQIYIKTYHKRGFRFVGEVSETVALARAEPAGAPGEILFATPDPVSTKTTGENTEAAKASIAVIPFENLSGDPENDYFGYGMTEDIIRLLARYRWLKVISRHSTTALQGRSIDMREVGEALGVRYVLVGSIRKAAEHVRITAELVRASDGAQIWAELYELQLEDIFGIQEEMSRQIAATIEPELSKVEQQLAVRKPPNSLDAWDCFQRGLWHLWAFTTPSFDRAESFFRRAIEIDPGFARAHGALGYVDVQRALYDSPDVRAGRIDSALAWATSAVSLDQRDCYCHCVLGRALSLQRRNGEASAALELAIDLNPSFAQAFFAQGFNVLWAGQPVDAEALLDRATMLSPRDSHLWSFHHVRAWAHFALKEFDVAAEFARQATRQPNVTYRAFATLAASLGKLDRATEAKAAITDLLERKPEYSQAFARQEFFFCSDPSFVDTFTDGLKVAGIRRG
jgi:TolB-like protein